MKLALVLVLSAATSSAETYRFQGGTTAQEHDHRCGKNIGNWTEASVLTIGHGQATLAINGSNGLTAYGADDSVGPYMVFHTKDTHTVIIKLDPLDCHDAHCTHGAVDATYSVIRHVPGEARDWVGREYCYEQWAGQAIPVTRVDRAAPLAKETARAH